MRRVMVRFGVAVALVALGWFAAKAQTPQPDFELVVDAPAGETRIECRRGCGLMWVQRGLNPRGTPEPTFTYSCTGNSAGRCSSGAVGGWLVR